MFRVDIGVDPDLRRVLIPQPRTFSVSRDMTVCATMGFKERAMRGLGVVGKETEAARAMIKTITKSLAGHVCPSAAAVLETGLHVNEILEAGAGVEQLNHIGLRRSDMREMGWLEEYATPPDVATARAGMEMKELSFGP